MEVCEMCLLGFTKYRGVHKYHASEPCSEDRTLRTEGKHDLTYLEYHCCSRIACGAASPQAISSTEHSQLFEQLND